MIETKAISHSCIRFNTQQAIQGGTNKAIHERTISSFKIKKNCPCGKMLRQDRDFSMISRRTDGGGEK
jgi:hypothetical protein